MTTILFFGRLGDQFGREVDIDVPMEGCTVGALRALLTERLHDTDGTLLDRCVNVCVDQEIVWNDHHVRPGQEIAILPALSGG